jgi:hypothetical protein
MGMINVLEERFNRLIVEDHDLQEYRYDDLLETDDGKKTGNRAELSTDPRD